MVADPAFQVPVGGVADSPIIKRLLGRLQLGTVLQSLPAHPDGSGEASNITRKEAGRGHTFPGVRAYNESIEPRGSGAINPRDADRGTRRGGLSLGLLV